MFKTHARSIESLASAEAAARAVLRIKQILTGLTALGLVAGVLLVMVPGAMFALNGMPTDQLDAFPMAWAIGVIFATAAIGLAQHGLGQVLRIYQQRVDDLSAQSLHDDLLTDAMTSPQDFILYLRPFDSTGQVTSVIKSGKNSSKTYELETQFGLAAKSVSPFVGLGESMEHYGAGRIAVSDDAWKASIEAMLPQARLLIVLPVTNPGTLWEVERILDQGLLHKTLWINVPRTQAAQVGPRGFDQQSGWPQIKALFAQRGFLLPDFSEPGALYVFGPPGLPVLHEELRFEDEAHLTRVLERALQLTNDIESMPARTRPLPPDGALIELRQTGSTDTLTVGHGVALKVFIGFMAVVFGPFLAVFLGGFGWVFFNSLIGAGVAAIIAVGAVYALASRLSRKTVIVVGPSEVVVKHVALWPWGTQVIRRLARGDIAQFFVTAHRPRSPEGLADNLDLGAAVLANMKVDERTDPRLLTLYALNAMMKDGTPVVLCPSLRSQQARYIEHFLELRFDIQDEAVPGEFVG